MSPLTTCIDLHIESEAECSINQFSGIALSLFSDLFRKFCELTFEDGDFRGEMYCSVNIKSFVLIITEDNIVGILNSGIT